MDVDKKRLAIAQLTGTRIVAEQAATIVIAFATLRAIKARLDDDFKHPALAEMIVSPDRMADIEALMGRMPEGFYDETA